MTKITPDCLLISKITEDASNFGKLPVALQPCVCVCVIEKAADKRVWFCERE